MSNKKNHMYRSNLMLVRISPGNGHNITIPISLLVLDQTFDALEDLVWVTEKLFLRWAVRCHSYHDLRQGHFPYWVKFTEAPSRALSLCREVINELRSYGRWRMLEVETADKSKSQECGRRRDRVRVYIDFI